MWWSVGLSVEGTGVQNHLLPFRNLGNFVQPTLPVSYGRYTKSRIWCLRNHTQENGKTCDGLQTLEKDTLKNLARCRTHSDGSKITEEEEPLADLGGGERGGVDRTPFVIEPPCWNCPLVETWFGYSAWC